MKHLAVALIAGGITASIMGCSSSSPSPSPSPSHAGAQTTTPSLSSACGSEPRPHRYFGVIDGDPGGSAYSWFIRRTAAKPTLIDFFFNFGKPWKASSACYAVHRGAVPLLQFNLRHDSAARIASGAVDGYVSHLAKQMRTFRLPIVISLGHEMNGNWYPWGWRNTPAATFVKMWRRVHRIFARQHASNVIWMWTVNRAAPPATSPRRWWPGRGYVNWVGIDGHLRHPTDTFKNVFGSTIADVRALTNDPILISESAVVAGRQRPARIASLFRTVYQTRGLIGIIYLNMRTARIDWRLKDTASLRAFEKAIKPYES